MKSLVFWLSFNRSLFPYVRYENQSVLVDKIEGIERFLLLPSKGSVMPYAI